MGFRPKNSAIPATGSGGWMCRRWPTASILHSSTCGNELRRNSATSTQRGWVSAPSTDSTGRSMVAACSASNSHRVRAGSSIPKKVSASSTGCATAPGAGSSSAAWQVVQSRPLAALMMCASAPEWSPFSWASKAGVACSRKASPLGTENSGVAEIERGRAAGLSHATLGDAGEMLDAPAKAAYRRRLAEIEDDIEQARALGDSERAAQAGTERDFLVRELSRAVGLGGRDRRAASAPERARVGVTRAVRKAMARIGEHHPQLGEHLDRAIRTGTFCVYLPDSRAPARWKF